MGLDMYACKTRKGVRDITQEQFFYWRGHPNLHGWMFKLHSARTGDEFPTAFNSVPVFLGLEDLDALEQAVLNNKLPFTQGFFFGESEPYHTEEDLEFIAKARALINDGWNVFYDSWW